MAKEMGEMTAEQKDKKQSHTNQISHCRVDLVVPVKKLSRRTVLGWVKKRAKLFN